MNKRLPATIAALLCLGLFAADPAAPVPPEAPEPPAA